MNIHKSTKIRHNTCTQFFVNFTNRWEVYKYECTDPTFLPPTARWHISLQSSVLHITDINDTVNMPTLKQKCEISDAIKCPLFDLRHFDTHVSLGGRCMLCKMTYFLETQNFKILVHSAKPTVWMLITCMVMEGLT